MKDQRGDTCRMEAGQDASAARSRPDTLHHAFQVTEGARTLGWSLRRYLTALKEAGLGSLPGTAAEVLDDETRAIICPDKLSTAQWLEVCILSPARLPSH